MMNESEKFFGVGLDNKDGHVRITKAERFEVHGGSKETHEQLQAMSIKLDEKLKKDGKRAGDISSNEFRDRAIEACQKAGIKLKLIINLG
jgi:diphthamide synthase (EF-2-diphthine--ammonia ligase)